MTPSRKSYFIVLSAATAVTFGVLLLGGALDVFTFNSFVAIIKKLSKTDPSSEETLEEYSMPSLDTFIWSKENALKCATKRCIENSNLLYSALHLNPPRSKILEETVARAASSDLWPSMREVESILSRFRKKTCVVVGGAPFNESGSARTMRVDNGVGNSGDDVVRVNLGTLPFPKSNAKMKLLPPRFSTVNRNLGLGTKTNLMIVNTIALREASCFANIDQNPALLRHLHGVPIIVFLHDYGHVDALMKCASQLAEKEMQANISKRTGIRLLPMNPNFRLDNARLLSDAIEGLSDDERKVIYPHRGVPFATTGFTAVALALSLCQHVRTVGLAGDTEHSFTNESYKPSSFHSLTTERYAMKKIRDCTVLSDEGICEKLTELT